MISLVAAPVGLLACWRVGVLACWWEWGLRCRRG